MFSLGSRKKAYLFLFNSNCLPNLFFNQVSSIGVKINHFYFKILVFWVLEVTSMQYKLFTAVPYSDKHLLLYHLVSTSKLYLVLDEELGKPIISALHVSLTRDQSCVLVVVSCKAWAVSYFPLDCCNSLSYLDYSWKYIHVSSFLLDNSWAIIAHWWVCSMIKGTLKNWCYKVWLQCWLYRLVDIWCRACYRSSLIFSTVNYKMWFIKTRIVRMFMSYILCHILYSYI